MNRYYNSNNLNDDGGQADPDPPVDIPEPEPPVDIPVPDDQTPFYKRPLVIVAIVSIIIAIIALIIHMRADYKKYEF